MIEINCKNCNQTFNVYPYEVKKARFCSLICQHDYQKTGKEIKCAYCQDIFYVAGWRLKDNPRFCSHICYWSFMSEYELNRGKNSSTWKGGLTIKSGYRQIKMKNGTYDWEHRVVMETSLDRPLGKKEIVHHWDENKLNNNLNNLALLRSVSAHNRLHRFADRHGIKVEQLKFKQSWLFQNNQ